MSLFLFPTLLPGATHAEPGVEANPTLSISPSENMNLTVAPGLFSSVSQTLSVSTTNYTGYTLTLKTTGTSTDLVSESNNTIPTITLPEGNTEGLTENDITLGYGYSIDEEHYKPAPSIQSESGDELDSTDSANAEANTYSLSFGAIVNDTTPAGTYTNSYLLTATANTPIYTINYNKNTEETVSNFPTSTDTTLSGLNVILSSKIPTRTNYNFRGWNTEADGSGDSYAAGESITIDPEVDNDITLYAQWKVSKFTIVYDANNVDPDNTPTEGSMESVSHTNVEEGSTINLIASNYSRAGFGFVGWSPVAGTNPNEEDAVMYGPNATITVPVGFSDYDTNNDGIIKLYAIWLEAEKDIDNNPIYFQGWLGCSVLEEGEVTALTDSRDNEVYAVAKLADGNCWQIENMRLDLSNNDVTITNINTNHPTTNFKTEATAMHGSNSTWDTCTNTSSACYDHISFLASDINRINIASYNANNQTSSWYSYGAHYNWYTATAGNGTYSISSGTTSGDLCPSGWHLPYGNNTSTTGNRSGGFYYLGLQIGAITNATASSPIWRQYPNNSVLSGLYYGSSTTNRNIGVYSWSSTAQNNNYAYRLYFYSSYFYPGTGGWYKYSGNTARCIASNSENFSLIFDANGGDTDSVPENQSATANGIYTFTIGTTVPARSGYSFAGWVDQDGTEVTAGNTYIAFMSSTTLYALWTNNSCNPSATTIGTGNSTDAVCLQDMNAAIKSSMPTADSSTGTFTLIDARDNKSYTVAKLDDGEVWMTQNLALEGNADIHLTPHDTDIKKAFVLPVSTTTNNTNNYSATTRNTNASGSEANGVFYSWPAAIASTSSMSSINVDSSICPSGWDLPTSAQYNTLKEKAGLPSVSPVSAPYNFLATGGTTTGSTFYYANNLGNLWTSTSVTSTVASNVIIGTSGFYTEASTGSGVNDRGYKYNRKNIRCIVANGTATIRYDANGGSGTMADQNEIEINTASIASNGFTAPEKQVFKTWCTSPDGSGTCANPGMSVSLVVENGETSTLYAIWDNLLTINYDANGGAGTTTPQTVAPGKNISLKSSSTFTAENKRFRNWNTEPDGSGTTYASYYNFVAPNYISFGEEVTLYAQWDDVYSIIYDKNAEDAEGAMAQTHTDLIEGSSITLYASNFSRVNYGFAGWSPVNNASVNGTDPIYGPNATISTPSYKSYGVDHIITLYAVWVPVEKDSNGVELTFQTVNLLSTTLSDGISTLSDKPAGYVTALRDERDDDVYAIAKLADDNYWMIENLRLDNTAIGNSDGNLAQGYGGVFVGLADAESSNFIGTTTENSLYGSNISGSNRAYRMPRYNNINTTSRASNPPSGSDSIYSYGNYYSWPAAIGSTVDYYSGSASTSICPSGWHLPTGSSSASAELRTLDVAIGGSGAYRGSSNTWRDYPNNFVYSGSYSGSTASARGNSGDYWSSTSSPMRQSASDGYYYAFTLYLSNSTLNPGAQVYTGSSSSDNYYKYRGRAIRCLAD